MAAAWLLNATTLTPKKKCLKRLLVCLLLLGTTFSLLYSYDFQWRVSSQNRKIDLSFYRLRPDFDLTHEEIRAVPNRGEPEQDNGLQEQSNPKPTFILDWTGFFGESLESTYSLSACPRLNCKLTSNRSLLEQSQAVVFHARDINWSSLPEQRHPRQSYVFFSMESPAYASMLVEGERRWFFNLTMTYRHDSDVQMSYGHFRQRRQREEGLNLSSIIQRKSRMVAWYASNCQTASGREFYVKALRRAGISVDTYGACTDDHRLQCPRTLQPACDRLLHDNYKFYLSFENSLCNDYVTEKFYDRVKHYVVPIVMERRNYDNLDQFPRKSFLAVDDYPSMEQLARHLNYLNDHDDEYEKYLQWHRDYEIAQCPTNAKGGCGFCDLCRYLIQQQNRKGGKPKIMDIRRWWHESGGCHQIPLAVINEYAKDDSHSGFFEVAMVFIAVGLMFIGVLFVAIVAAFRCFTD